LKILYVDDNSVNTVVGRKLLSRFGYNDIDICYDGSQAMTMSKTTAYDLILLDLQMPVDGYTALAHIRTSSQTRGRPRVVALTANADENTRSRCVSAGFDGFLSKPLVIATLAETLKETWEMMQDRE
jgi:CheY-like chemotaxis protein